MLRRKIKNTPRNTCILYGAFFAFLCITHTPVAQAQVSKTENMKDQLEKICTVLRTEISSLLASAPNKDYVLYNNTLAKANLKVSLYNSFKCSPLKLKDIYDKYPKSLQYDIEKPRGAGSR